jgi:hypothetical protein
VFEFIFEQLESSNQLVISFQKNGHLDFFHFGTIRVYFDPLLFLDEVIAMSIFNSLLFLAKIAQRPEVLPNYFVSFVEPRPESYPSWPSPNYELSPSAITDASCEELIFSLIYSIFLVNIAPVMDFI